jgi:hypothetical protein
MGASPKIIKKGRSARGVFTCVLTHVAKRP